MNQQRYERLRAIRADGQLRYFLVKGVLSIGIPFTVLTRLLGYVFKHGLSWPRLDMLTAVGT